MILDSRIKAGKKPLTCFDIEIAKQFLGKKGYFSHHIDNYADLTNTVLGILGSTGETFHESFCCTEETFDNYYYEFFLPAEWAEQKSEINFEPYTLDTWQHEFKPGEVIIFRGKKGSPKDNIYYECIYNGYLKTKEGKIIIILGPFMFPFNELFEFHEINRVGTWEPFGRKVENIDICAGS